MLKFVFIVAPLLLCNCRGEETKSAANSEVSLGATPPQQDPSARPPNPGDFVPVSAKEIHSLAHAIKEAHPVVVELSPYCEARPQDGDFPFAQPPPRETHPQLQQLQDQFKNHEKFLGALVDNDDSRIILVFEPDFTQWSAIQGQAKTTGPLPVELRPGCHTAAQRQSAERVLREIKAGPLAQGRRFSWREEPSFAGYRVLVTKGGELAEEVKRRLPTIAEVWAARTVGPH